MQKENRIKLYIARRDLTVEEWKRIIFSNKSPIELVHTPNRQNDRIWAPNRSNIQPISLIKHPLQMVISDYNLDEILNITLKVTYSRKRKVGSTFQIKMAPYMSTVTFQQDGGPAHHS